MAARALVRRSARARRPPRAARRPSFWRRRLAAIVLLAAALAAGYFFWLRDSSLVAVQKLTVTGVSGPQAKEVRSALARAAGDMTTLHIRHDELERAVAPYPIVKSVTAEPSYPHGLTVRVQLQQPALVAEAGGRTTPVAADGTVLRGVSAERGLPALKVPGGPLGARLRGESLQQALILGATPSDLRPYILESSVVLGGVRVQLRNGPELRFGDGSSAAAKWVSATRVLADRRVGRVGYVDVSAPGRAAVGGIVQEGPAAPAPASEPVG